MSLRDQLCSGVPLHFDPAEPEAVRVVEAAWIEKAIALQARVDLEHALVRGPLDLRYASIEKDLRIVSCTIKESADLSYATFNAAADFSGSTFESAPNLQHSIFEYELSLNQASFLSGEFRCSPLKVNGNLEATGAIFADGVDVDFDRFTSGAHLIFTGAIFGGDVRLSGAHIVDTAYFYGAIFRKKVTFEFSRIDMHLLFSSNPDRNLPGATLNGDSNFVALQVGGVADFRGAIFQGEARFFWTKVGGTTYFGKDVEEGLQAAEFHGESDFREANLAQTDFDGVRFGKKASFDSARFGGSASFKQAVFEGAAEFGGVRAADEIDFSEAKFTARDAGATFEKSVLSGNALFAKATFEGDAVFQATRFEGTARFAEAEFKAQSSFKDADFLSAADFSGVKFAANKKADFDGARFRRGAYFKQAKFPGEARFETVEFQAEANFAGVTFETNTTFEAAHFFGIARFRGEAAIPGTVFHQVSFSHATFDRDACFDDAIFLGGTSFRETDFRVAYFAETGTIGNQKQFQSTVDLTGCTYRRIHVHWRSLLSGLHAFEDQQNKSYDRQPYSQLEKVFREVGEDGAADEVYLERRRTEGDRIRFRHAKVQWLLDRLYRWGANYGIRPVALIWFAIIGMELGMLAFQLPGSVKDKAEATPKVAGAAVESICPMSKQNSLSLFDSARLSIRYFLPVDVPLLSGCEASEHRRLLRYQDWAVLIRLLGWVLVPVGIASLAGVLRRAAP